MTDGYAIALERIRKAKDTKAESLDLSGLGLEKLPEEMLESASFLTHLNVDNNNIGEKGAECIAKLNNLTSLNIKWNHIGEIGAAYIAKLNKLTSLKIDNNKIREKGAEYIAQLNNLTSLNIENNNIGEKGAEYIAELNKLTSLNIKWNRIGEKGAEYIAKLNKLTSLNIGNNSIGDIGAEYIADLNKLTSLNIEWNRIGEKGAEYIAELNNLTSLNIENNNIREIGTVYIAKLNKLTSLNIGNNNIGDIGAGYIAELNNLTSLNIEWNRIGEKGAEYIAKLNNLTSLNIQGNNIGEIGAEYIAELNNLTSLNIENNNIGEKGTEYIAELNNLTSLNIENNNIGEIGTVYIAELNNLTSLNIGDNHIGDNGAQSIAELNNLTSLNIDWNRIGEKGTEYIAQLKNLTSLNIEFNYIGDLGAEYIAQLNKLTSLNIGSNDIGDKGAECIAILNNLTSLDIQDNRIGENGAEYIARLNNLTSLDIRGNSIGENGAECIAKLQNLTSLDIRGNSIGENGVESITKLNNLTSLRIEHNHIGVAGIKILYNAFKDKVVYITFSGDEIKHLHESATRSWESLKQYYSSIEQKSKTTSVSALNVLLLGNTTAGKSSMMNFYLNPEDNPLTKEAERTFGITYMHQKLDIKSRVVNTSFWDFGGQEYFHGTHRLFFGIKNALYLVLWEPQYEQEGKDNKPAENKNADVCYPFRYWLGTIQHFNNVFEQDLKEIYQRALLIQSKMDIEGTSIQPIGDVYTDDNNRFILPAANIFNISVKAAYLKQQPHDSTWKIFKHRLTELIDKNKATYEFNEDIIKIKEEGLPKWRKEGHIYFEQEEFIQKCTEYYDDAEKHRDLILNYLDGGGILRFPFKGLEGKIFIHPERLLNGIYEILSQEVKDKGGRFKLKDIQPKNLSMAQMDIIINIMHVMDLVFIDPQTESDKEQVYIAPQYMEEDNASGMLKHLRQLLKPSFMLRYPDFMPRAFITQFISRKGGKSVEGVFWKFGVLYEYDTQTKVLVEADPNNRHLRVFASDGKTKYKAIKEVFEFFTMHEQRQKQLEEQPVNDEEQQLKQEQKRAYMDEKGSIDKIDYKPIEHLELSADGINFATIQELLTATKRRTGKVKTTTGDYMPVDSIFHKLLNSNAPMPKKIFFSYAHHDKKYKDEFLIHFANLRREGLVETWNDAEIPLGGDWDPTIKKQLNEADIVLYMLSPSFMSSHYIWEHELKRLREQDDTATFVPIFISPCDFRNSGIDQKQGAPLTEDDSSIAWIALHDNEAMRNALYLQVVDKIRSLIR